MRRYEVLFLAAPELTSDEAKTLEVQYDELLKSYKALLISFERWGKYRLAYPVRNNDYGVYFLVRFEVTEEKADALLKDIHTLLAVKHNELIMRYMTSILEVDAPLSYHRPESLEEVPSRDVDTFLKESKMSGLIDKTAHLKKDKESVKEDEVSHGA